MIRNDKKGDSPIDTQLRIGLVGLDTSHCLAFTKILQDKDSVYHLPGARVCGLFPGGTPNFSLSRDRVKGFTEELNLRFGIPLYTDIAALAEEMDALMLLSADGRQHLDQFQHMAVGKPVFIDKPLATSTGDSSQIIRLAAQTGTPILSCSSLRFAAGLAEPLEPGESLASCESFGPATVYPDYPGLFWYGVHAVDVLYAWMGTGCRWVQSVSHPQMDVVIGEWQDGRLGVFRGTRFAANSFGCVLHTNLRTVYRQAQDNPPFYFLLMKQVLDFFQSRRSPVSTGEMSEVIAFIEAAHLSSQQNGARVDLASA